VHSTGIWVGWRGKMQAARRSNALSSTATATSTAISIFTPAPVPAPPPQFPPFIISGFIQEGNGDWWVGRRPSGGSLAGQLLSLLPLFFFPFFFSAFQLCDFVALPNTCMLMQQPSLSQHSGTRKAVTRTKHMI